MFQSKARISVLAEGNWNARDVARADFDRCTFLTANKLRIFWRTRRLAITQELPFRMLQGRVCVSGHMTGKLKSLEMSECENLKDDALVHLMKTSSFLSYFVLQV